MKNTDTSSPAAPQPGRYRHYKGMEYEVFGLVRHSETEEWLVHYRTLYGDFSHWVRPLAMFTEQVEVNGEPVARFEYVGSMDAEASV
ncbi:DUF1653 domain-containing protein [Oceanobacter mangrovi]|uniref:DUF1653 domain-containing protein n=1 Tax=Oceanobacter mangrovi TaxID=2862510 RepID=UPI001C8E74C2|nr:DUF1653 domain-containing protein [Oceanobacter mangrovi]